MIQPDASEQSLSAAWESGLPLAEGFRAAAAEAPPRPAAALTAMAEELEKGRPWQDVLSGTHPGLSPLWKQTLREAVATKGTASILLELLDFQSRRRHIWRETTRALSYPCVLLVCCLLILGFSLGWLLPLLDHALQDISQALGEAHTGVSLGSLSACLAFGLGGLAGLAILGRWFLGGANFRRLTYSLPLLGPAFLWAGIWEFSRKLGLLVGQGTELAEALRATGADIGDPYFAVWSRSLAEGVSRGERLSDLLSHNTDVPSTWTRLVAAGETGDCLEEALDAAATLFEQRLHHRATLLSSVVPTILYVMIGGFAVCCASAVLYPLTTMASFVGWGVPVPPVDSVSGLPWIGLLLPGFVLWWGVHLTFLPKRYPPESPVVFALRVTAACLMLAGVSSLLVHSSTALTVVFAGILTIVWGMTANRYRRSESRQLLQVVLSLHAAGVPLDDALRAFAEERTDDLGIRVMTLADDLRRGTRLSAALAHAKLPADVTTRLWTRLWAHPPIARWHDVHRNPLSDIPDPSIPLLQRLAYLGLIPCLTLAAFVHVATVILPWLHQIFEDFELELPMISASVYRWSQGLVGGYASFVGQGLALAALFLLAGTFFGTLLLYYLGWMAWEPPIVRRWLEKYHGVRLLQTLANRVAADHSMSDAIDEIAAVYPVRYVRRRLQKVVPEIRGGASWTAALQRIRLFDAPTIDLLRAAQQAGNLSWAMREAAELTLRRLRLRDQMMVQMAAPIVLLLCAVPIGLLAVTIFLPIVKLVEALA